MKWAYSSVCVMRKLSFLCCFLACRNTHSQNQRYEIRKKTTITVYVHVHILLQCTCPYNHNGSVLCPHTLYLHHFLIELVLFGRLFLCFLSLLPLNLLVLAPVDEGLPHETSGLRLNTHLLTSSLGARTTLAYLTLTHLCYLCVCGGGGVGNT